MTVRVALSLDEAASSLGVSRDTFERYVVGEIRVLRIGRRVLVPVSELARYAEKHASRSLVELEALRR